MPVFTIHGPEGDNGLLSALALPRQRYYRGLLRKAAALFRSLVKNHPFIDGNKRFALAALHTFLL
jgi:death-on-curing protein